jgi:NhaA family Na+:H+ antiporter
MSPAESLIEKLHPVVAWAIMPVFALANAGVSLDAGPTSVASLQVTTAVVVGLVLVVTDPFLAIMSLDYPRRLKRIAY